MPVRRMPWTAMFRKWGITRAPTEADTDGDGLSDGEEVNTHLTDPTNPDTDGDGLQDGAEVIAGTDPLDPDSDDDNLSDSYEVVTRPCLNPLAQDTDEDGVLDDVEVAFGSDPCSAASTLYSIAGTVSYGGSRTGQVVVSATAGDLSVPDLLAVYPFNGNADDESGNGNHGTVNGATLADDSFGNAQAAYAFPGGSSHIDCGDPADDSFDLTGDATLMGWMRFDEAFADSRYQPGYFSPLVAERPGWRTAEQVVLQRLCRRTDFPCQRVGLLHRSVGLFRRLQLSGRAVLPCGSDQGGEHLHLLYRRRRDGIGNADHCR